MFKKSTKQCKYEIDKRKRDEENKFKNRESNVSNDFLSLETYQSFKKLKNIFLQISILKYFESFKLLKIKIDVFK